MALSKAHLAALEAWKKGEGEFPDALNQGQFFDNDDHLKRVIDSKLAPATKAAREKLQAELLDALGVTDPEELSGIKQKLAEAAGTVSEVEKLRSEKLKHEKELKKRDDQIASLQGFQVKELKRQAIEPLLAKVAEPFRATVRRVIESDLTIKDEKVLAPGDIDVPAFFEEFLKTNPAFKAPETKAGAGTGPNGGKSNGAGAGAGAGSGSGSSGGTGGGSSGGDGGDSKFPKDLGGAFAAVLREKTEAAGGGAQ